MTFMAIIDKIEGQIVVEPFGKEIIEIFKECYKKGQHSAMQL